MPSLTRVSRVQRALTLLREELVDLAIIDLTTDLRGAAIAAVTNADANRAGNSQATDRNVPVRVQRGQGRTRTTKAVPATRKALQADRGGRPVKPGDFLELHGMGVVTLSMVSAWHPERWQEFQAWMANQTLTMFPSGESAFYVHDYERWRAGLAVID